MNMFKPVKAKSLKEYFDQLSAERREPMNFLDKFIKGVAPTLKPVFSYNMPGYGTFKYKNYKGEIIDWPIIALASQKNYISVYVCAVENGEYIAEKHKNTAETKKPTFNDALLGSIKKQGQAKNFKFND